MKKGQAAMEYLMTYGWAILVVIVVIVALYTMGVFTPTTGVSCTPCFPAGGDIAYEDHTAGALAMLAGPREINNITVLAGSTQIGSTATGAYETGDKISVTEANGFTGDLEITVQYNVTGSGLTHSITATLHGA